MHASTQRSLWRRSLLVANAVLLAACGSRARVATGDAAPDGGRDGAPVVERGVADVGAAGERAVDADAALVDAALPDAAGACAATPIGQPCADDRACGAGFCAKLYALAALGACSCDCTPDDPRTPAMLEDSCPDPTAQVCAALPAITGGQPEAGCLQRCAPQIGQSECPTGLACRPEASRFARAAELSVCLYPACAADRDCYLVSAVFCDPQQNTDPDGANPACAGNDARCVTVSAGPAPAGRCVLSGACEPASGLCRSRVARPGTFSATATVGDPCADDTQCGPTHACWSPSKNANGDVVARNGYCAIVGCAFSGAVPDVACDAQSSCLRLGASSLCLRNCALEDPGSCRGHAADQQGDYECQAWSNFNQPNRPLVAAGPVCVPAALFTCADLQATQVGCNALGVLPGNPTQMTCRRLDGTPTVNPYDPTGYCLDTTGSGP